MSDQITKEKWDKAASNFDLGTKGVELRWAPWKQELFSHMDGRILFLALGTGLDIPHFPSGKEIVAVDISPKMIEKAQKRVGAYDGQIEAKVMDVHELTFKDGEFDQVFTSCTFCSVPNPVDGLRSLRRVLKPGGELYMFEHTGSRYFPLNLIMNGMTLLSRLIGPEMNRNTVQNVQTAGFKVLEVNNVFLDVVKTIKAVNE